MLVMKFGGTSVASAENITKVKNILFKKVANNNEKLCIK